MSLLVTGAAGFIGYSFSLKCLQDGEEVVGIDNLNNYYDVNLKKARLSQLAKYSNFKFIELNIADREKVEALFQSHSFEKVVNLAAQAGVRYSLKNPHAYIDSNIVGFTNIIDSCRHSKIEHFVYASSSSVYGANEIYPFSEKHSVGHPLALYAATKRANELIAHSYSHLYDLPSTGLRFFTAYGPWGRPDMALFLFTKNILLGRPIDVYNHGDMIRDFTYIDDIVEGIYRVLKKPAQPNLAWSGSQPDLSSSKAPYKIYNIGNSKPTKLMLYISEIEKSLGKKAVLNFMEMQQGDVPISAADITALTRDINYIPRTSIEVGVKKFVDWYMAYYY